jgi:hypothetical protein
MKLDARLVRLGRAIRYSVLACFGLALCGNYFLVGPAVEPSSPAPGTGFVGAVAASPPSSGGSLFELNVNADGNGPSKLDDNLGSTGLVATLSCDARDISGTSWPCDIGGTFSESGTGTSPTSNVAALFTESTARAVQFFASQKRYEIADQTQHNVTTQDIVIEMLVNHESSSQAFGKKGPSAANNGYAITASATNLTFSIGDGVNTQSATCSSNIGWSHAFCALDKASTSGMRCWCSGAPGTATNPTSVGSLDTAAAREITIGGFADVTGATRIAAVRMWVGNIEIADMDAIAKRRAAQAWGVIPRVAATPTPNTMTRASAAFVDRYNDSSGKRSLYLVSNNTPRVVRRQELTGGEVVDCYLDEVSTTNLCLQSEAIDNASWTKTNTAVTANESTSPFLLANGGATNVDRVESTDGTGSVEHFIRQAVTLTATTYAASIWVDRDTEAQWVWIRNATIANGTAWFDTDTCTAGTKQSGVIETHVEEEWEALECRVGISFTGTAASHNIDFGYSNADNVTAYDDGNDANADQRFWGAEVEAHTTITSYQPTTSATVTRQGDDLSYLTTGNVPVAAPYSMMVEFMMPSFDVPNVANSTTFSIGTSGDFAMLVVGGNVGDSAQLRVTDNSVAQVVLSAGTPDLADGERHVASAVMATDDVRVYADGVLKGTDTSATIPLSFAGDVTIAGTAGGISAHGPMCITRAKITSRDEVLQ